ncbi:unnamed protein product [Mytilus edulis]|uniref:Uncharacterized protein n=1 Tax=Mytilus edulis TaxID=6550 RepID=A0A8S3VDY7_MYTED|nr:unnamed protein product [Mytilus edulis]
MVHHAQSCMVKELSNFQVGSHDNENIELGSSNFEHSYTVGTKVNCKENVKRKRKIACVSEGRAEISQHYTVIVSLSEGIFCSTINIRGPGYPVHLIKKTAGDNTESFCEHLSCIEIKETAVRGNNITFECPHLMSTPYAVPGKVISLTSESLQELKDNYFITEARFNDLLAWKNSLTCTRVPLAVTIPQKLGSSQRYLYLSIYTGVQRYWSRTGRTIVTIDTSRNTVTCKCSNTARYCLHKAIGKWYMFQELHQSLDYTSPDETEESGPKISEDDMVNEKLKKANLEVDLEYLQSKRIPSITPKVASYQHDQVQNNTFSPKETHCHICSGGLKSEVVSTRSKVISMTKIVKGE